MDAQSAKHFPCKCKDPSFRYLKKNTAEQVKACNNTSDFGDEDKRIPEDCWKNILAILAPMKVLIKNNCQYTLPKLLKNWNLDTIYYGRL